MVSQSIRWWWYTVYTTHLTGRLTMSALRRKDREKWKSRCLEFNLPTDVRLTRGQGSVTKNMLQSELQISPAVRCGACCDWIDSGIVHWTETGGEKQKKNKKKDSEPGERPTANMTLKRPINIYSCMWSGHRGVGPPSLYVRSHNERQQNVVQPVVHWDVNNWTERHERTTGRLQLWFKLSVTIHITLFGEFRERVARGGDVANSWHGSHGVWVCVLYRCVCVRHYLLSCEDSQTRFHFSFFGGGRYLVGLKWLLRRLWRAREADSESRQNQPGAETDGAVEDEWMEV